jgi:hypothetical protein
MGIWPGAVIAILERGRPGEIYNAVNNEPVFQIGFYQWLMVLGRHFAPIFPQMNYEAMAVFLKLFQVISAASDAILAYQKERGAVAGGPAIGNSIASK